MAHDSRSPVLVAGAMTALAIAAGALGYLLGFRVSDERHKLDIVEVLTSTHAPDPHSHAAAPEAGENSEAARDSAYASGGVVVAGAAADPLGVRRKMSLERATHPTPVIVGVAGASGSGKTSIASLIAARLDLSQSVVAISCDNYYRSIPADVDPTEVSMILHTLWPV